MPKNEKTTYVFRLPVHSTDVAQSMPCEMRCDIQVVSNRAGGGQHMECEYSVGSYDEVLYGKTTILPILYPETRTLWVDHIKYDISIKADTVLLERVHAQLGWIDRCFL